MAISITWGSKIINVPRADLTLLQGSPELRELDLDWFRLQLKTLEESEAGMPFPDTHRHVTQAVLAGITYARLIEVINGYTVQFEDGQYTVSCTGANHNLSDVKVANQVSLIVNNSAGLQIVSVGSGLSAEQDTKLDELHKLQALDPDNPLTITPNSRQVDDIDLAITGDGKTSTTVTRQ